MPRTQSASKTTAKLALADALPSRIAVERELCRRSLYQFAIRAWNVLEPGRKFKGNWHIDAICEHLEAVSDGRINRLLINVPPRHMKSLLVSVIWPVWDWLSHPSRQFLTASYVQKLSTRDALKSRQLIQSPWFQSRFGDLFQLGRDQNEKQRYQNSFMGHRIAISASGGVGEGGDFLIADDPQNTDEMGSDAYVEATTDWWNNTFNQRLNDQNDGAIVLTMQRLSERDICEQALAEGGWVHLMLPAEFETARKCKTVLGFEDPRTEEGELLWPNRIGRQALDKMKKRLGSYGTAGQLQQRPAPRGGGIMKRDTWRRIKRADLPSFFHYVLSWDTAATTNPNNDPTGATVWGLSSQAGKAGLFRLGQLEEWMTVPQLGRRIPDFGRNWPNGIEHLIEAAGPSGLAMIQQLKETHPHLTVTPADPRNLDKFNNMNKKTKDAVATALGGSKEDRAQLAAVRLEAGLVWLIDEADDPTTSGFLDKADSFPKCQPRDVVDSAIQAILYCCSRYTFESSSWEYFGSGSSHPFDDDDDKQWQ